MIDASSCSVHYPESAIHPRPLLLLFLVLKNKQFLQQMNGKKCPSRYDRTHHLSTISDLPQDLCPILSYYLHLSVQFYSLKFTFVCTAFIRFAKAVFQPAAHKCSFLLCRIRMGFFVGWAISRSLSTTPHPIKGQGGSILLVHYSLITLKPAILVLHSNLSRGKAHTHSIRLHDRAF